MIIFCEKKYAENLLQNGFTKYMLQRDLSILAKYYKYLGRNKKEIWDLIVEFCKKYNSEFNEIRFYGKLQRAVDSVDKYRLRLEMDVIITEKELNSILQVGNQNYQKIFFIMLAIVKYTKINPVIINSKKKKDQYSDRFYVNARLTEILKLAKINVNKKERIDLLYSLESTHMITTTMNGSYEINYIDIPETSGSILMISDMNNLLSFFPFYCEGCGKRLDRLAKRHKKCKECYTKERYEKEKERKRIYISNKRKM